MSFVLCAFFLSFLFDFDNVASLAAVSRDGEESKAKAKEQSAAHVHQQVNLFDYECVPDTEAILHKFDEERRSLMTSCKRQSSSGDDSVLYHVYSTDCFYNSLLRVCDKEGGTFFQDDKKFVVSSCQGKMVATNAYYYECFASSCGLDKLHSNQDFYEVMGQVQLSYPMHIFDCDTAEALKSTTGGIGGASDGTSNINLRYYAYAPPPSPYNSYYGPPSEYYTSRPSPEYPSEYYTPPSGYYTPPPSSAPVGTGGADPVGTGGSNPIFPTDDDPIFDPFVTFWVFLISGLLGGAAAIKFYVIDNENNCCSRNQCCSRNHCCCSHSPTGGECTGGSG